MTGKESDSTMQAVGDSLKRVRRGFLFGFSAAVGAWVALAVLGVLVHSIR